jgi:hypothetical protein
MPTTIIGNNQWNARGLVLSEQSAQDQVNGLINVQAVYVGPSSKHDKIVRSFYPDAPPPIFPSIVSPGELLTGKLYLEQSSITRANGLTTVSANYVGGLYRGRGGFHVDEERESETQGLALNTAATSANAFFTGTFLRSAQLGGAPDIPVSVLGLFNVTPISKRLMFVRVKGEQVPNLPTFTRDDVGRLSSSFGVSSSAAVRRQVTDARVPNANFWIIDYRSFQVATFDYSPTEGNTSSQTQTSRNIFEAANIYTKDGEVPYIETFEQVTPSVVVVTREYSLV